MVKKQNINNNDPISQAVDLLLENTFNFQKNSWWNKKKSSTWPKIWFYLILGFIFFTNWNIMLQILHKVIFYNVGI